MSTSTPTPEGLDEKSDELVESLLRRLGFSGKLRGFRYLTTAIAQTAVDPDRIFLITKSLYPDIARQYETTVSRVERTMRHSIRRFWDRNGREAQDQVTDIHLTQRPTNSELIDLLANYIRHSH